MPPNLIGILTTMHGKRDSQHLKNSRRAKTTAEFRGGIKKGHSIWAHGLSISAIEETLCQFDADSDSMPSISSGA